MENYVRYAREQNFSKFNDSVRTELTRKLCADPRVQDYMEKKEMYKDVQEQVANATKLIKGEQ